MDDLHKSLHEKLKDFIGPSANKISDKDSPRLSINELESYIIMKALEGQRKYLDTAKAEKCQN